MSCTVLSEAGVTLVSIHFHYRPNITTSCITRDLELNHNYRTYHIHSNEVSGHRRAGFDYFLLGSPKQRGIISYGLAPNRQKPFAGAFSSDAIFNIVRRIRREIVYILPPAIAYYYMYTWAKEKYDPARTLLMIFPACAKYTDKRSLTNVLAYSNHFRNSKEGRAYYAEDEEE